MQKWIKGNLFEKSAYQIKENGYTSDKEVGREYELPNSCHQQLNAQKTYPHSSRNLKCYINHGTLAY